MILSVPLVIVEDVGSVATGPFVDVIPNGYEVEVGKGTSISVFVYETDGEEQVPKDLIEVTVSASLGSFDSDTGITDQYGYCTFDYQAPDIIEGPTDVYINATADTGPLGSRGSEELLVTYRLNGIIEGPSLLEVGSTVTIYTVNVTANGDPMGSVNIMPTVYGKGTLSSYTRQTGADGRGYLRILPSSDSTGQINIMVQLGRMDYLGSAASRLIQVVDEMAPMSISISPDPDPVPRWGSCYLNAIVSRGGSPASDVSLQWDVSTGDISKESTSTNFSGGSSIIYSALPGPGLEWSDEITVNVTACQGEDVAYAEETFTVDEEELSLNILNRSEYAYGIRHSQLYPGEEVVIDLDLYQREYEMKDDEWSRGMILDLVVYDPGGEEYHRETLGSELQSREEFIIMIEESPVWTIPEGIPSGNYTWELILSDRGGRYQYWSHTSQTPLLLNHEGEDDWTILYYIAGKNNLAPWYDRSLRSLKKKAPDGEYKVYCCYHRSNDYDQWSRKWDGTKYFDLEEGYGEDDTMFGPNTGKPDSLTNFLEWATGVSTTGHYCLIFSDHGMAHRGIGADEYWKDYLTIQELENSLGDFSQMRRDLDVFVMDACHMASLEVANYVSEYTSYQVFSQMTIYSGHAYDTNKALINLNSYDWNSASPSALQVATDYLNAFIEVAGGTDYDSPACVVDSERAFHLAELFNEAMRSLYVNWDLLGDCLDEVYDEATRLEGPFSDQWNLTDLKEMLTLLRDELSDYILDPNGRSTFNKVQDVLSYFESAKVYFHPYGGLNGLNLFLPDHMEPDETPYSNGLSLKGHHDKDYWLATLDILWSGNYYGEEIFDPLPFVEHNVIEEQGEPTTIQVNLTPGENTPNRILVRASQWSARGSKGNLSALSVLEGPELDEDRIQVELRVPSTDLHTISVTALDEAGEVMTSKHLGHERLNGTDLHPPQFQLKASSLEVEAGETVTYNCTVDGYAEIYWDLDSRNGIYVDRGGNGIETEYRRPGNLTVTCMVLNDSGVSIENFDIKVLPAPDNKDPVPSLAYDPKGCLNVTLQASGSSDPDGDPVQYRYNFGDGNWTDWTYYSYMEHEFGGEGSYNCSLKVRDNRGGESHRTFLIVEVEDKPLNRPPVAVYEDQYKIYIDENLILDLSGSYDPEGGPLEVRVEWGDGTATEWGSSLLLEHDYESTGSYSIRFYLRDDSNNTAEGEITVIVRSGFNTPPPPQPPLYMFLIIAAAVILIILLVVASVAIILKLSGKETEE